MDSHLGKIPQSHRIDFLGQRARDSQQPLLKLDSTQQSTEAREAFR